jgi:hypothetical protein
MAREIRFSCKESPPAPDPVPCLAAAAARTADLPSAPSSASSAATAAASASAGSASPASAAGGCCSAAEVSRMLPAGPGPDWLPGAALAPGTTPTVLGSAAAAAGASGSCCAPPTRTRPDPSLSTPSHTRHRQRCWSLVKHRVQIPMPRARVGKGGEGGSASMRT